MTALGKYVVTVCVGLAGLVVLSTVVGILSRRNQELRESLSIAVSNEKALMEERDSVSNSNRVLHLTIEQLEYYGDSISRKLLDAQRELKIKDKNLKQMQYLLSEAEKKDTVVFRDTIFRNPDLRIDTVLGDRWYQIRLGLRYPNTVAVNPKFVSEKIILVDYRKETVEPPKKCFLARWFQKKHKIVEVEVIENNPYIENKQQRFVEIIK